MGDVENRGEFELVGPDPDPRAHDDRPAHRRRVYQVKSGGMLVVWGRDGNLANINKMNGVSFPCVVVADWIEPGPDFKRRFDHRYWVREDLPFSVVTST